MKRAVWLFVSVLGCGDNKVMEQPDAFVPPPDTEFEEAPHGTAPQLVDLGGGVLTAPKVQPIFFANDATVQAQIEDFLAQLATSTYWTTTTSEYGVGTLTILPTIVATETPPTQDTDLTSFLTTHLDGTHAGWPAVDPNTIYSVFLPAGVVLHSPDGDSCSSYGAYHDELMGAHGESLVYALMPRCHYQGASDLDELTESASHELIEAVTDPRVETTPAFGDADKDHYVWALVPGAETGDFCEYLASAYQPLVGQYMVQRTWSNASAAAGHDPCVPAPAQPYIGAAPVLVDDAPISGWNGQVTTKAVKVPLNMQKTIEIDLFSDQPTDAFSVAAIDANAFFGSAPELQFQWDKQVGKNGDKLHLLITRKKTGTFGGGTEFVITTKGSDGTDVAMWWGFAAN